MADFQPKYTPASLQILDDTGLSDSNCFGVAWTGIDRMSITALLRRNFCIIQATLIQKK